MYSPYTRYAMCNDVIVFGLRTTHIMVPYNYGHGSWQLKMLFNWFVPSYKIVCRRPCCLYTWVGAATLAVFSLTVARISKLSDMYIMNASGYTYVSFVSIDSFTDHSKSCCSVTVYVRHFPQTVRRHCRS